MRLVMAGPGLLEAHRLPLAFGTNDDGLEVQKIAVVALVVQRLDMDQSLALIYADFGGEVGILQLAQTPLPDLRPELAVLIPVEPEFAPLGFGVRGEGHRAA